MATQRFSAQFKREAVRLLETSDKPITQLALELGVPRNRLYKWRDTLRTQGADAFPGSGRRSLEQLEIARLKRELTDAREENQILKKAEAYFASQSKRGTPGSTGNG
jgi:transposase